MKVITNYRTTLSASMTSSQNTVPVTSMLTTDNHTITASDFDSVAYLVIEPGSANMEIVKVTGVSGSTFTGAVRGLAFYGGTETSVSGNQKAHQAGGDVIMTNAHYYFDKMMDLDSNETVTGIKTFTGPNYPKMDDVSTPPVDDEEFATKKYVDDTAIAGGAKMTPSVYGIAKLSSAATDPTAPVVVNNEEVSAAGGTGAGENKIVKANASGYIDKDYIEVTADKGLQFNGNALEVEAGTGVVLNSSGVNVDVGTTANKILQLNANAKIPAVDGSLITNKNKLLISGTPVSTKSTTGAQTLFTTTLAGGLLSTNNGVEIIIPLSDVDFKVDSKTCTFILNYGATAVATITVTTSGTSFENANGFIRAYLLATGATNTQRGIITVNARNNTFQEITGTSAGPIINNYASGTAAEDSTADKTLTITTTNSDNNANFGVVTDGYIAKLIN